MFLGDMEIVESSFFDKTNLVVTSAVKNASCSRGWLRIVVECTFGMFTVASFVLIVLMAVRSSHDLPDVGPRCELHGCRVVCTRTPYYEKYEDDIIFAVSVADTICDRIMLTLNYPLFPNYTIPPLWMSRMRTNIDELIIFDGNLRNIWSQAFMTQFSESIRTLILENIIISRWTSDMLAGLSSLENLSIIRCVIEDIDKRALEAIDDTLTTLTVTMSGRWLPNNVTGSSNLQELSIVDFSSNHFSNVLERRSFSRLRKCKILYLNSCRINAINAGAFDNLVEIELLYLNNNFLITVPPGLFEKIISITHPRPRLHVQDNLWHCNCSKYDLMRLSSEGMLVVDPWCYSPENMKGMHLSNLEDYCYDYLQGNINNISDYYYMNGRCRGNETSTKLKLISPVSNLQCSSTEIESIVASIQNSRNDWSVHRASNNYMITPSFAIQSSDVSMFEISSSEASTKFGLLWYQTNCPNEIYCINTLPNFLRVYNVTLDALYVFCPLQLSTVSVPIDKCISYSLTSNSGQFIFRYLIMVAVAVLCLTLGATGVYALIRKYPSLLKGSKRVLFVKHKNVEALILPPKIKSRPNLLKDDSVPDIKDKGIFMLADSNTLLPPMKLIRTKSVRSAKSNVPSYISALEPTEAQLAEWRLRHLDNISTVTSLSLELPPYSWYKDDSSLYYSISYGSTVTTESLK